MLSLKHNRHCKYVSASLCFVVAVMVTGCAVTQQKALEPLDWINKDVERYSVTGMGSWARIRKQPLTVGPFTGEVAAQSVWSSLPVTTSSDVQISVGSDDAKGHRLESGTVAKDNESELQFRLLGPSGALADLRCRQHRYIEDQKTGVTRGDGTNGFSVSEQVAYSSTFNCKSRGADKQWPQWRLDLGSSEAASMQGHLMIDGVKYEVAGSQSSNIGRSPYTVSYEISRGGKPLVQVDRSGNGLVSLMMPVGDKQHVAFVGAAAALLLANDPLEP
jgi:hypothetical protein